MSPGRYDVVTPPSRRTSAFGPGLVSPDTRPKYKIKSPLFRNGFSKIHPVIPLFCTPGLFNNSLFLTDLVSHPWVSVRLVHLQVLSSLLPNWNRCPVVVTPTFSPTSFTVLGNNLVYGTRRMVWCDRNFCPKSLIEIFVFLWFSHRGFLLLGGGNLYLQLT